MLFVDSADSDDPDVATLPGISDHHHCHFLEAAVQPLFFSFFFFGTAAFVLILIPEWDFCSSMFPGSSYFVPRV